MASSLRARWMVLFAFIAVIGTGSDAPAQTAPRGSRADNQEGAQERVVIEREAMRLIDPKRYQVALDLRPVKHVTIAAPVAGIIKTVLQKPGDKLASGTSVIRLDDAEQALLVEQAEANLKIAEIELRRAKSQSDSDLVELAEARRAGAVAAEKLAKLRHDKMTIRVPFDGEVFRTSAVEGQVVAAGTPLLEFADPSRLRVEIPFDRNDVKAEQNLKLTVEDQEFDGKVENILPLDPRFATLREFGHSLVSVTVILDNKNGRLRPGQLVDLPIIPQHFVAQIPHRSLSNAAEGQRKVQVVRNGIIRNVNVKLLGQVGSDLSYVSGTFAPGDELIVGTSKPLADGTQVRPATVAAAQDEPGRNPNTGAGSGTRGGVGF